eukprot:TRINITY_DN55304_c0_g1_i1.p1 TRINITY_DN55304_c0_g1~~TRINITY_DN55304_c0_g1_i1.p1  ORF type:complete len:426 (+),score=114.09 TRINITY_DN55304_c0_g1_i1:80-1357(+)
MLVEFPALLAGWPPLWATAGAIITISLTFAIVQIYSAPPLSLAGKHVVLTGAAGDVPTRVARLVLAAGAHLTLVAHSSPEALHSIASELGEHRQCKQQQIQSFAADLTDPIEASEVLHRAIHQQAGRVHALLCLEALSEEGVPSDTRLSLAPQLAPPQGHVAVRVDRAAADSDRGRRVVRIPTSAPLVCPPPFPSKSCAHAVPAPPDQVKTWRDCDAARAAGGAGMAGGHAAPREPGGHGIRTLPGLLIEQFVRLARRRHHAAVHALSTVAPYMQAQAEGGRVVLSTGWAQPLALSPEPLVDALTLASAGVLAGPLREQRIYVTVVQPTWQTDPDRSAAAVVAALRKYRFLATPSRLWGLAGGSIGNGVWGTPATSFWSLAGELVCLGPVRLTAAAALAHARLTRRRGARQRAHHGYPHPQHCWA